MGKRDFRHREAKKPKKDGRKPLVPKILSENIEIEEVRKGRRGTREENARS